MRYNEGELSSSVSQLPLDAHRRVSSLILKAHRLPIRYNTEGLSTRVSPLPLDAQRRVSNEWESLDTKILSNNDK